MRSGQPNPNIRLAKAAPGYALPDEASRTDIEHAYPDYWLLSAARRRLERQRREAAE